MNLEQQEEPGEVAPVDIQPEQQGEGLETVVSPIVENDGTETGGTNTGPVIADPALGDPSITNATGGPSQLHTIEGAIMAPTGTSSPTGKAWDVTIIGAEKPGQTVRIGSREFIESKNGRFYDVNAIKNSVEQWDGVKVYDNHLTPEEFNAKKGMRSPVSEWLGVIVSPYWDEKNKRLRGTFKVVDQALAAKLKEANDQNIIKAIGLSIDTFPQFGATVQHQGRSVPVIEGFKKILSVDLVGNPAAGGGFNRIIAAETAHFENLEETQDMEHEDQVENVEETTPAAPLTAEDVKIVVLSTLAEALAADDEQYDEDPDGWEYEPEQAPVVPAAVLEAQRAAEAAAREANIARAGLTLDRQLAAAKLSPALEALVRPQFEGRTFENKELEEVIKKAKAAQVAQDPTGGVNAPGRRPEVSVGLNGEDKFALEATRLIMGDQQFYRMIEGMGDRASLVGQQTDGVRYLEAYRKNPDSQFGYRRMSHLLMDWFEGDPLLDGRAIEAAGTSTLATVVKNTVNIMTAADYSQRETWYQSIVTEEEVETIDDATLARVYGVNSLSVVDEGQAYTELALQDEEETAVFVKKGNFVGITLETLLRDRLNFVRRIPRTLSDAWYNTLSDLVANVFTVNTNTGPVLSDTGALFNATAATSAGGHANLGVSALSFSTFSAARTAMRKQTDQPLGAGRKIMAYPRYLLVPVDLETTAEQIRDSEYNPDNANDQRNPFYNKIDVIPVPSWTDTNNWAAVADPAMLPAIFLVFPKGQRTPQLFTADSETSGSMFTNDSMRFKVRMLTYRFSATYDCAPVADFRPLYKANVA